MILALLNLECFKFVNCFFVQIHTHLTHCHHTPGPRGCSSPMAPLPSSCPSPFSIRLWYALTQPILIDAFIVGSMIWTNGKNGNFTQNEKIIKDTRKIDSLTRYKCHFLLFHFILFSFCTSYSTTQTQLLLKKKIPSYRIHIISYLLNPKLRHYIFKYVNKTDNKENLPMGSDWASFLSWPSFLFDSFWNQYASVSLKLPAHNFHLLTLSKP